MNENNQINVKVLGIIPARIGSTRLPNKMLKDVAGKTLIERTCRRTLQSERIQKLVVATDSDEIEEVVHGLGVGVVRSLKEHKNGSERAAEAIDLVKDFSPDVVVVIWGDEPMFSAALIDACIDRYMSNDFDVVGAAFKITDRDMIGLDCVGTVVTDCNDRVLYISRATIPHDFTNAAPDYYHSTGILVTSPQFLKLYSSLPPSRLEKIEGVEQLRILENGYSLGVVRTDERNIGVNTEEEYKRVVVHFGNQGQ